MGIFSYEDFRAYATRDDLTLAVTGSPWSSRTPTAINLQTTSGRSRARAGTPGRLAGALNAASPDLKNVSISAEFEFTTTAYGLSLGFSNPQFLPTVASSISIAGAFYCVVENFAGLANHAVAKIYHAALVGATGDSHNIQLIAESAPFSRVPGRYFFDFHVSIDDAGLATMRLAKDGSQIVSGTVHVDNINSGRQVRSLELLHITTDAYFTNVVVYKPDEVTPFPLGAVDIINIPASDLKLRVGPVDDSLASSVEVMSNAFSDYPVTSTLAADANILAAKAVIRYTAGGGNQPTHPEFAVALPTIGQKTVRPTPEAVPVGAAPRNLTIDLSADNPTPAQLNATVFRFRSIAQ